MTKNTLAIKEDYFNPPDAGLDASAEQRKQIELLEQHNLNPENPPKGFIPFYKDSFTLETEQGVRELTKAWNPAEEAKMPPQDKLVKLWGWFHGTTGFSVMFRWESGRQDAYVILDIPEALATKEQVEQHKAQIISFQDAIDNARKRRGGSNGSVY